MSISPDNTGQQRQPCSDFYHIDTWQKEELGIEEQRFRNAKDSSRGIIYFYEYSNRSTIKIRVGLGRLFKL